jgi:hypothetical protein
LVVGGVLDDILTGVRWNLSVILILHFLYARDGEHFFMCFWPFLYWFIDFWGVWFFELPVYPGYQSLSYIASKDFLPFCV